MSSEQLHAASCVQDERRPFDQRTRRPQQRQQRRRLKTNAVYRSEWGPSCLQIMPSSKASQRESKYEDRVEYDPTTMHAHGILQKNRANKRSARRDKSEMLITKRGCRRFRV